MARHRSTPSRRDRQDRDAGVIFRAASTGRGGGRHRAEPTGSGRPARWASAVATGALVTAGAQIAAPSVAAAQPAVAPAPVALPPEVAVLATLPEVDAVLDQFAAAPGLPEGLSTVPAVPPAIAPSPAPPPAVTAPAVPATPAVPLSIATPSPLAVAPVSGTLTSSFGPRWGATHAGLDIANSIGTPIYAAATGTVIDSGPASGFGLWVQIRHDDGSTSTYGHINETLVTVGQRVQAGEQIATVGNRGQSTGPHLHFETTNASGTKIDPTQWLAQRGVPRTALSKA